MKVKDFDRFKQFQNPKMELEIDKIVKNADINFGRDDSEEEELDANIEKVQFGGEFETDSVLAEMKRDIENADQ